MQGLKIVLVTVIMSLFISACGAAGALNSTEALQASENEEETMNKQSEQGIDQTYVRQEGIEVIYLAGGCFWGIEKLMQSIPGVVAATSGYANGQDGEAPTYNSVITGQTGYRETVRVEYDPQRVSLDALLYAYFHIIDPTIKDAQGNDRGTQYQTGIYYSDEASQVTVERIADVERSRYEKFVVEIEPLERFYDAEEYHQDYLDKNPGGYCHISTHEMTAASSMIVDPAKYPRPSDEQIKSTLTDLQFRVTQESATERPFENEYWDHHARGIYVDIVTGEPLFSSSDKYDSNSGWPSFSRAIDINTFFFLEDNSLGMRRVEVRSRTGNSHLGHLFENDPTSPTGTRFCINSAALRFIQYEDMQDQGYGYLLEYVD